MRRRAAALISGVAFLAACAPQPQHTLADSSWEVVAIYVDPEATGAVPADAAGRVTMTFGSQSITAQTGCAPLQAKAEITEDSVSVDRVQVGKLADYCIGGSRRTHEQLTAMLTPGAEFDLRRYGETGKQEITLTKRTDDVDSPTIRLVEL